MKLALAFVAVAAIGCSRDHDTAVSAEEAKSLLVDRNWLDVWPTSKDDRLHVYRFVPSMGGGVFQDRTVFKGTFELFQFETQDDQIRFTFPHTSEKVTSRFRIDHVDGPHPFDLKLSISDDPRGPHVYYGMKQESAELKKLSLPAAAE